MLETPNLYLYLMLASLSGPLLLSFDKKVAYYRSFVPLIKAIVLVAIPFLLWDIAFTYHGIWGFNEKYTGHIYLYGLPLGEYLFFLIIPFCCVFIYEVLNSYIARDVLAPYSRSISNFLLGFMASMAVIFYDRWYTALTFALCTLVVYWHAKVRHTAWLSRFYLAYAVTIIPLCIVNGILTGTAISEQVVWYNDAENMGRHIFTIPVEDFFYGFLLLILVIDLFESFKRKKI